MSDPVILAVIVAVNAIFTAILNFVLQRRLQPHIAAKTDADAIGIMTQTAVGLNKTVADQNSTIASMTLLQTQQSGEIFTLRKLANDQSNELSRMGGHMTTQDAEIVTLRRDLTESRAREDKYRTLAEDLRVQFDGFPDQIATLKAEVLRERELTNEARSQPSNLTPSPDTAVHDVNIVAQKQAVVVTDAAQTNAADDADVLPAA
jgi:hypothetical protein